MLFKLKILYFYLLTKHFRSFKNREALLAFQEKKVRAHLGWILNHSSFYRRWFGARTLDEYRTLPFLDKKIMMENFTDLNTVRIDRDEALALAFKSEETRDFTPTINGITVGLSSGTSGNRGLFLVSENERARHAGTILAKILPGSLFEHYRVAFFMRANSNLYTASQSSNLEFRFFDLMSPIEGHLEALRTWEPDLLFAPPSMLIQLAKAQREGKLNVKPRKIISIAETLDPLDEKRLVETFHQPIHQVYQCTEGFLGITCEKGVLHLNEDCVQIEPYFLDEAKTKFMPIITDFSRTSQPLVRYRLNDILTLRKTPCACGSTSTAIESIEGRADDLIYFGKTAVFPDFIRRAVIQSHPAIEEYLVTQKEDGVLSIHIQCQDEDRSQIEESIPNEFRSLAQKINAELPGIRFEINAPERSGKKLRRVVQEGNVNTWA